MTLREMSQGYQDSAEALRARIAELRIRERLQKDAEDARRIRRRINTLTPIWREMREMASLTAHYYDRSYYRHGKYVF